MGNALISTRLTCMITKRDWMWEEGAPGTVSFRRKGICSGRIPRETGQCFLFLKCRRHVRPKLWAQDVALLHSRQHTALSLIQTARTHWPKRYESMACRQTTYMIHLTCG